MDIYNAFARVYDSFMGDTPYESWANFILERIKQHEINPRIMCELGCGTGKMVEQFAKRGIEMIGIDYSEEMLMIARENAYEKDLSILYLHQDMSAFELYGTVDVIYSSCDSMNYLLEEEQVKNMFVLVNNYLEAGGLFVFDINTPYKYKEILKDQVFAEQTEDAAYIWENTYNEEEGLNEFCVNFFIETEEGLYERTEEVHYQKAYTIETIKRLLDEAGMELVAIYDDYTMTPYHEKSQRATFVAKEKKQSGKWYADHN
jgi:SAM-dependent methyltransferase